MNPPSQRLQMLAVIKLRPGKMLEFNETMTRVVPIMAQFGWELAGAWTNIIGRFNVVYDLWTVPDANAVMSGFLGLMQRSEYPELAQILAGCVEDEQLQLMMRLPYDPGRV